MREIGRQRRLVVAEPREIRLRREPAVLRPLDLRREIAGGTEPVRLRQRSCRSAAAAAPSSPGSGPDRRRSGAAARAPPSGTSTRARPRRRAPRAAPRSSPAALSVNVTATICDGRKRAARHLPRDPPRDRRRLPGARAGEDADRTARRLGGGSLLRVQPGEDPLGVHRGTVREAASAGNVTEAGRIARCRALGELSARAPSCRASRRPRACRPASAAARARRAGRRATPGRSALGWSRRIFGCPVGADRLVVGPELLVQRLAGAGADERDRDVGRSEPGSLPERRIMFSARSRIFTGSPMSRTKISPAVADRARLHDERHGLRDRHEVPRHLRVRHGDRPAARDLRAEDRDHAAGRVQDVAEAHRDELASRRRARWPNASTIHSQSDFALAHHRLPVHGLVGGDQHEPLDAELDRDATRSRASRARCS